MDQDLTLRYLGISLSAQSDSPVPCYALVLKEKEVNSSALSRADFSPQSEDVRGGMSPTKGSTELQDSGLQGARWNWFEVSGRE